MKHLDPTDRDDAMDACAEHTWRVTDRKDFEKHGIRSEAELRQKIAHVVNNPDTRVFRGEPTQHRGHPQTGEQFTRETYILREFNAVRKRDENTVVVLNRNVREGQLIGGSAWINANKNEEKRLLAQEVEKSKLDRIPEIIIGGRPALREQDSHRQVVVVEQQRQAPPPVSKAHAREELTPARTEQLKQEAEKRANDTMAQRWQREQAERAQQGTKSQNHSQRKERAPEAETMAQRWQREQAERARQDQERHQRQEQRQRQNEREQDR